MNQWMEILGCSINYDWFLLIRLVTPHKSTCGIRVLHFFGFTACWQEVRFLFSTPHPAIFETIL